MAGRNRQLKTPNGKIGAWISKSPAKSQAVWKQDTLEGLEKGSRVWYKAGVNSWVLGTLQAFHVGLWTVALDSEAGEGTGQASPFLTTFLVALETLIAHSCCKAPGAFHRLQASGALTLIVAYLYEAHHVSGLVAVAGHHMQAGVAGAGQPCYPGWGARFDRPHIPE